MHHSVILPQSSCCPGDMALHSTEKWHSENGFSFEQFHVRVLLSEWISDSAVHEVGFKWHEAQYTTQLQHMMVRM